MGRIKLSKPERSQFDNSSKNKFFAKPFKGEALPAPGEAGERHAGEKKKAQWSR